MNKFEMRRFLRRWIPPGALEVLRGGREIRFVGDFESWDDARSASSGYDDEIILEKVTEATQKVRSGIAACERDSVVFDEIEYSWPLLAGLMWSAAQSEGRLSVLDFGGSLGSVFYQVREFLAGLAGVSWNIVEQEGFVRAGKQYFESEHLRFYNTVEQCVRERKPNTILFSSVLQYLEDPGQVLKGILPFGFDRILIDRTTFLVQGPDRLVVQRVPPDIYDASYPCWFFRKEGLLDHLGSHYEVVAWFNNPDECSLAGGFYGGCILKSVIT